MNLTLGNLLETLHQSQLLDEDNGSDTVWADSAYRSDAIEETLDLIGFDSQIHERGHRTQLSLNRGAEALQSQQVQNTCQGGACVWYLGMQMGGKLVRSISIVGVKAQLELKNLTYNLSRYTFFGEGFCCTGTLTLQLGTFLRQKNQTYRRFFSNN